ncbi:AAA family ATPase [Nostoc sp. UCD121]|uniref:AAA family ATPase n=1 Tax=unclassified Nostoc TaxID=2593658 RepID=UPI0016244985|nr:MULTISPECIES: ATP-binding protein [unclassified Nostoc]MBC1219628.1 AAA family ATPase [Nostoc sp. UCD120]MBC1275355.1 AAA family ATPase [Nostoc sp. UCD121]MBC1298708.1 AAA family ATPase [Nostoc sp. UCD122]
MKIQKIITQGLSLSNNAISYHVSQELAAIYPKKALLESNDSSFNLEKYAEANFCKIKHDNHIHNQILTGWNGMYNEIYKYNENARFQVSWQGNKLDVVLMSWNEGYCKTRYSWILADSSEVAENFFAAVCEWNSEIRDELLVFEDGYWDKNPELFQSIQDSTFENLVLHKTLKQDIQDDLINFFASRETYANYSVPWKRGILFIGSPGNGKTHTVKALINQMQQPCLYVKSFKSEYATDSDNIRKVFKQARQSAPCVLVLEDIDSLLNDENRSFFLNELDGFASNQGIVTIATTNHPERLDSAISDRPSRFDRKYHFDLPAFPERETYITLWNDKLNSGMGLSEEVVSQMAALTEGFSFAYLKELFLSSMISWMGAMETGGLEKIMISQVAILREQMGSTTVISKDLEN